MTLYYTTFSTDFGEFSVAVDHQGAVAATAFGGPSALQRRVQCHVIRDIERTARAQHQLSEYFRGERHEFTLPLAPSGTAFQQLVWIELQRIPYGQTRTYAQIAVAIGRPSACRAVGRANATNPVCLIVPCHRVIGSDRSMTGFAFGEEIKRDLLAFEATRAQSTAAA